MFIPLTIIGESDTSLRPDWLPGSRRFEVVLCPANPEHAAVGWKQGRIAVSLHPLSPALSIEMRCWELVLSQVLIDGLRRAGLTGFFTQPATVWRGARQEEWHELRVTGWGGVAREASGIREVESRRCPTCGTRKYSPLRNPDEIFDPAQWDGSDLFRIWPLPDLFLSERAAEQLRASLGAAKIAAYPAPDPDDFDRVVEFGPYPLDVWMPRERALALAPELCSRVPWVGWNPGETVIAP